MHWIDLIKQIAPTALAFTPAAPFIPAVLVGIELAEHKGGTGAEKKAMAVETAVKIAQGVEAVKAGTVDPATVGKVVSDGIETAVGIANLVHKGPEKAIVVSTDLAAESADPAPTTDKA